MTDRELDTAETGAVRRSDTRADAGMSTMDVTSDASAESPTTPGIGSRAHIRETLDRAREAIRLARARTAQSRTTLARSEVVASVSERMVQESLALRAQLRPSVTAYVRQLQADGVPSERMLVLVKSAVREAVPPELDVRDARALMEDVVRWSIDAYYHAA